MIFLFFIFETNDDGLIEFVFVKILKNQHFIFIDFVIFNNCFSL